MKITKKQIEQKLKQMEKAGRGGGPSPRIFEAQFKSDFIKAVLEHGDNGAQVRIYMNKAGHDLSYKQAHVYMRRLFGTYPNTGRPPKYLGDATKRTIIS